jgi:hypothetical protein
MALFGPCCWYRPADQRGNKICLETKKQTKPTEIADSMLPMPKRVAKGNTKILIHPKIANPKRKENM